ncbi:uncharacterized protein LOC132737793 [Ruditapes philippinarum]|uniref:uncharacterized protein LOC132737793 n=1 Tax=Ruditapes philippinarum TaxID=129788 RepID=UPI00295ADBA4|nr:uncharacterized protein LOC132737793 [Ruditapes philippinarum]
MATNEDLMDDCPRESNSATFSGRRDSNSELFDSITTYFDNKFKSFKRDFRQEVQAASTTTFKKFKESTCTPDLKYKGNKKQFLFNKDVYDNLDAAAELIEQGEQGKSLELIDDIKKKVCKRNKLIKIADKSSGGWETVREYESDELASDSEDEKRLRRAESRALSKQKARKRTLPVSTPSNPYVFGGYTPTSSFGAQTKVRPFRSFRQAGRSSQCFACGGWGHFRAECPKVNGSQLPYQRFFSGFSGSQPGSQSAAPKNWFKPQDSDTVQNSKC